MIEYAYWSVVCKTKDCGFRLLPGGSYIGPCDPNQHSIYSDLGPPDSIDLHCPHCYTDHTYKAADFQIARLDRKPETDAGSGT